MTLARKTAVAAAVVITLLHGCGGGGSGSSSPAPTGVHATGTGTGTLIVPPVGIDNSAPISVDAGPIPNTYVTNIPYVSVTVCTPGTGATTAACQTIDHIQVDTMSSGLRILQSALSSSMQLPEASYNGSGVGECMIFADGFTWGSVRVADIYIGSQVATSVPIQDIADLPGGVSGIPSACSSQGVAENTLGDLGANGILGVGMFMTDGGSYFTCGSGSCSISPVTVGAGQTVQNPVMAFAENRGVVVNLNAIPANGGVTTFVSGTLAFGINTQTNNTFAGTETPLPADATTAYLQTTYTQLNQGAPTTYYGFLDSGSSALFYNDGITACPAGPNALFAGLYCPTGFLSRTATNLGFSGTTSTTTNFTVEDPRALPSGTVAANIAGTGISNGTGTPLWDWGLPFFYGRKVFLVYPGVTTTIGATPITGPSWAY